MLCKSGQINGYKYTLHSAELENTSTVKDLGVIFVPMFGIIKRNFIYLSDEAFVSL